MDARTTEIKITVRNDEVDDTREYTRTLDSWLEEDDGGSYGYKAALHQAGSDYSNDPYFGEEYYVTNVEVVNVGSTVAGYEEPKFVKFRENNDNEGESWNYWLQYNGNENELQKLKDYIDVNKDYFDVSYVLDMTPVSQYEVDVLVKHSDSGYNQYENRITGTYKFTEPEEKDLEFYENTNEYFFERWYKGGIKDSFTNG